jgi:RNA polymerase sigma-70 factor, ECF subfamily
MHNQHVNNARRNVREDNSLDVDTVAAHLVAVTDPTASRQLRELDKAIGKLAMEQRQVILLIGLEGMSYKEAAAILDVPIGTVRSRLSRGREALRRLMEMEEDEAKLATAA